MSSSSPQRNSEARERARKLAAQQSKKSSNSSRRWLQIAVVVVLVLLIAAIALVYTQTKKDKIPDSGPVPSSANQYGGIVLTKDGVQKDTSDTKDRDINDIKKSSASATPSEGDAVQLPPGMTEQKKAKDSKDAPRVTIFQDYNCIHCAEFESSEGKDLEDKVLKGEITLEIRNLNFLDRETSTEYSSRAAEAAYSVADQVDTKEFLDWEKDMFSHQGQGGLDNDEIADIAKKHGADIKKDLDDNTYRPMVNVTVKESQDNGISGTPTVFIDSTPSDPGSFSGDLTKAIDAKKKK